jgi:TonB-dependent receptor
VFEALRMVRCVLILVCLACGAGLASAQTGAIGGQLVDETGGALPGGTISLRQHDSGSGSGREHTAIADANGRFTLDQLPIGTYTLTVTLSGFGTLTLESVEVTDGRGTPLRLVLKVADIANIVNVTGTAFNYASSIAGKRMADGVVDMFNTDEIGRLPDKNIGETLNRIPGVSMLLEKGEGRFVQIRGISPRLNNVTINGMAIGHGETENGGRLLPLDVIGGELLSSVQVLKTPTPDMDGQGIGGTLNLTTKQPFDFTRHFTALLSTRVGFESIQPVTPADTKETPHATDATLAGQALHAKLGWLGGASYSNRKTPLLGIFNDTWRPVSAGGATITYPTNVKNNVTVTGRERLNVNGSVEARPNPSSHLFVRSFVAHWNELQFRERFDQGLGDALMAIDGTRGGTITSDRVQVNLRSEPTVKQLFNLTAGASHHFGAWSLDYQAQHNQNAVHEPNDNWEFRSGTTTFGPDAFHILDDGVVEIASSGRDRQDPAFQTFRRLRYFEQMTNEGSYAATADVRRDLNFGAGGAPHAIPGYIKFGAKFTRTTRDTDVGQQTYGIGSTSWTAAQTPALTRGAFSNPVPIQTVPNLWLDLDGLNQFFQMNRHDPRYFVLDPVDTYLTSNQSDFSLRERVAAAYGMAKAALGRVTLVGGVRVESTDVSSNANTMIGSGANLRARPISGSGSYTNVLPSIVAAINLRDDLVARAAFTTSVGRPEYDAIAPRSQLSVEDNPSIGTVGSLSIGNPDLKARTSKNFDVSLEWYFNPGALVSVAGFRKNITNEIIPAPTERFTNYTFQDQHFDQFDINTTINAEKAHVQGVELTFADKLQFLPAPFDGFGVGTSLTFIDSGIKVARGTEVLTLPLLEQARRSQSLTLYYQKGRWDLSGTYKYNSNFLTDYGASRALDLDQGAFGRWDFRAQYSLTTDVKIIFSGINLNDEPTTEFQGGNAKQITEYEFTGRTFFFGVSARLGR